MCLLYDLTWKYCVVAFISEFYVNYGDQIPLLLADT